MQIVRPFLRRLRYDVQRVLGRSGAVPVGAVRWGDLRRTEPLSHNFGRDRGQPIDRYYIEGFLSAWSGDVAGHVLEIKDATYTRRFGRGRVSHSDVLDIDPSNPDATIIADLSTAHELRDNAYDCIILTQTLQLVYGLHSALGHLYRALKPGGAFLVTVSSITPLRRIGWHWNFTDLSLQRLLCEHFASGDVMVKTYGNLLTASAFLYGLSAIELNKGDLDICDLDYQVIVAARAVKTTR